MTVAVEVVDKTNLHRMMRNSPHINLTKVELDKFDAMCCISDDVYIGLVSGQLACVWGLVPPSIMSSQAYLWLYSSPLVEEHKFLFVRHSQRWVERVLQQYDALVGFCDPENKQAIRWIEWLGGEFKPVKDGRKDFIIRKHHGGPSYASCG